MYKYILNNTQKQRRIAMNERKPSVLALLPIVVFLVIYLASGIYFEYIDPVEGGMGFYIISPVVAFTIALGVALVQNKKRKFYDKIRTCARGIGDENITMMLFIFLLAGAFGGIAKQAGGAESTANMLLSIIPDKFAVPGLFLVACLISMAMGTSVGTITVLAPIAADIAASGGFSLVLCVGTVVGGAMFGDNLSFISDTTIAATRTQGVEMRDKFFTNIKIALPAAIVTLVVLIVMSLKGTSAGVGHYEYNIVLTLPYLAVIVLALLGMNVLLVLGIGIALFMLIGAFAGTLSFMTAFSSMSDGTAGMFETMIVTILVASIGALMNENGGFAAILKFIGKYFKGKRGGMVGIGLLTIFLDVATANNTVAIVMAAPIAKDISEKAGIEPKKTASLLDTCSCIAQGIIPYGAQLLIAGSLAGISSVTIIPMLLYPYILAAFVALSIIFDRTNKKAEKNK